MTASQGWVDIYLSATEGQVEKVGEGLYWVQQCWKQRVG